MSFETLEGSLAPDDISPELVDGFSKLKRRLEAEKILHNLYRIVVEVFVFFFNFDFQMHKKPSKQLCLRDFVYWRLQFDLLSL